MNAEKILVLLVGQSNMAGRGYAEPGDLIPVPHVEYLRPDFCWAPAIEPITKDRPFVGTFDANGEKMSSDDPFETVMPSAGGKVCGVGPGRTFGRLLAEACPGREVGLIPAAVGGTSISAWMPGGVDDWDKNAHPYDAAIKWAKEAQKYGTIAAVLWHQGENDAAKNTPDYKSKMRTVVENFRRDLSLGDAVPFIAGELASFYTGDIAAHADIVDNALYELAGELPSFYVVKAKDLTHRGDNLHFDAPSQHTLGSRYFEAFKKHGLDALKKA